MVAIEGLPERAAPGAPAVSPRTAGPGPSPDAAADVRPLAVDPSGTSLRFADVRLEAAFRRQLFANVIVSVRAAHVLGIATWAMWGLLIRQYTVAAPEVDLFVRFGVLIPLTVAGLIVTTLPIAERVWELEAVAILLGTGFVWSVYVTAIAGVPFDLGYVGVILIMAFSYTLVRLRFELMAFTGLSMIALYVWVILAFGRADQSQIQLALYYLVSFYVLGMIAAYTLERFTRLLFLRERQLDRERARSDGLLLNILPAAIADRLKERAEARSQDSAAGEPLAEEHEEVAVLFADLAGFTEQAERMPPDSLVAMLNGLFSEMDALAERHGLEKIKTIGDAYMAVAGVPVAVSDPAARAVDMALDLVATLDGRRWPSGEPIRARVGIAAGPVVAGVIGRQKFAYDVWGDTVNLASRLEAASMPGRILVSEALVGRVGGRFAFGPIHEIDIKGKGSQAVCFVEGREAREVVGRS